ncbi:MAG TPA: glycosyltransferase family 4 protein [Steroidobacteraceae bacterium]|nr:glycosyltransferase family 4 protein [Steroidobacteraceae bacterium]
MNLLGLIPEPPFDPLSWSGLSAYFFRALREQAVLLNAEEVSLGAFRETVEKTLAVSMPLQRWKERYHSSVSRFAAMTKVAAKMISAHPDINGVLQVGAWFSSGSATRLPCFSYHDGNAALQYRYYGRGLVSEPRQREHLSWERSVYSNLTGIFVMSKWLADSFIRDFGMPAAKVHVVGAGINIDSLPALPERSWAVPKFLLVGKDFQRKGGKYLLEAFEIVRREIPEAQLTVVGPELQIKMPGLQCPGYLAKSNPEDLKRLKEFFRSATAVVLPSIYEPFGVSLLEGMAFGLPCIASDRCAMPEIVHHGQTGFLVPAEDSRSLGDAMIQLAKNPVDAAKMGLAGRRRIESTFTWNTVAGKIKSVLLDEYHI